MGPEFVISFGAEAIKTTLLISLPLLMLGLIVGLAVSIFQATTQIQEITLTFVPKIVVVLMGALFFGPWMLEKLMVFTHMCFSQIPMFIR